MFYYMFFCTEIKIQSKQIHSKSLYFLIPALSRIPRGEFAKENNKKRIEDPTDVFTLKPVSQFAFLKTPI